MIKIDIVVTIPRKEYQNDDKETEYLQSDPNAFQFWTISRKPTKLNIGERIYFVKNNKIESSMEVFDVRYSCEQPEQITENCIVTNRQWKGCCILYMTDLREENIPFEAKGFQGFRYKWWEDNNV